MKKILMASVASTALLLTACGEQANDQTQTQEPTNVELISGKPELGSFGVELQYQKSSVKPGDNFFEYANGVWLDEFEIPGEFSSYSSFTHLYLRSEDRIKAIIDELAAKEGSEAGSVEQLVGDYYKSWMDTEAANEKGIAPLQPLLDKIAAIDSVSALAYQLGRTSWDGGISPFTAFTSINRLNPDEYQLSLSATGLGLPDRDYYLADDESLVAKREAYQAHIATMLAFAGMDEAATVEAASAVMALETEMAKAHWTRADRRNRDKTLNPTARADFDTQYPDFDWTAYFEGVGAVADTMNVSHPSAINPMIALVNTTDLDTWKAYLTYHTISNHATLLSEEIDNANFAFYGTEMRGQPEQRDRWKRGVALVGSLGSLGEGLGQIYVERHFPAEAKEEMTKLVENLRTALGERINGIEWMGPETKTKALEKLASFRPKIGYPDEWRSYDGLEINSDDLFGNFVAIRHRNEARDAARLSQPTDREEWAMTPQTINAYYNPPFNEIVFPAAILQPPFFDLYADPAVNYGAIGAVIGHEMGHGFDDQGSKSDARGIQTNWWTDEDRANFEGLADILVEQYNGYEALEGQFVDGRFTLGENIGDIGGLAMAYHAYRLSLGGKEAPIIDGLTGDQRFFLAFAQVWRGKYRDAALLQRLKSDPHSPAQFRANGAVRNHPAWYEAFGVEPGDALYIAPEDRVTIW